MTQARALRLKIATVQGLAAAILKHAGSLDYHAKFYSSTDATDKRFIDQQAKAEDAFDSLMLDTEALQSAWSDLIDLHNKLAIDSLNFEPEA